MFSIIQCAWFLVQLFIAFQIVVPAAVSLLFYYKKIRSRHSSCSEELHEEKDFAVVVHAGEETSDWQNLVASLLQLDYSTYTIYLVAGKGCASYLPEHKENIVVLRCPEKGMSRVRLHRFVVESFCRAHTHLVFLNPSSVVTPAYLSGLNARFNEGYQVVQSARAVHSNQLTSGFIRNAGSYYARFITGKLPFVSGASAALSGNGMAFTISTYKTLLKRVTVNDAGFKLQLQKLVIRRGQQVAFAPEAIVYEKGCSNSREMVAAHARQANDWAKQFLVNARCAAGSAWVADGSRFLFSLLAMQMPLVTCLLAVVFCCVITVWTADVVLLKYWAGMLFILLATVMVAAVETQSDAKQPEWKDAESDRLHDNPNGYSISA